MGDIQICISVPLMNIKNTCLENIDSLLTQILLFGCNSFNRNYQYASPNAVIDCILTTRRFDEPYLHFYY